MKALMMAAYWLLLRWNSPRNVGARTESTWRSMKLMVVSPSSRAMSRKRARRVKTASDGSMGGREPATLEGRFAAGIVADADGFLHLGDEDLAVSDGAGAHGLDDGANHFVFAGGRHHHFELELVEEIHLVLAAAVDLFVALLAAVAAHLAHGEAVDADVLERLPSVFQLGGLNDCFNLDHGLCLEIVALCTVKR